MANRKMGATDANWTNATINGVPSSSVIIQAEAALYIQPPI
jgi:hypothetical protein